MIGTSQGFYRYLLIVFINAFIDLGHKILIQNTIFKLYDGPQQIFLMAVTNALILLPFILCFSPAGLISDRYAKSSVIFGSIGMAIPVTLGITFCYYQGYFWPAFWLTFILALQSAFYSPAKYGYIRDLLGKKALGKGNGFVQSTTIVAILAGVFIFSVLFESVLPTGPLTHSLILHTLTPIGWLLVALALSQWLLAMNLPKHTPEHPSNTPLVDTYRWSYIKKELGILTQFPLILLSILCISLFMGINQVILAIFGAYLKDVAGVTNTIIAQGLMAMAGIGIVIGSLLAGRLSRRVLALGLIPIGAMGVSLHLLLLPLLHQPLLLGLLFGSYGLFGGLFLVPLHALIQYCSPERHLGQVLAGSNLIQNSIMSLFLGITIGFSALNMTSIPMFYLMAVISILGTIYVVKRFFKSLLRLLRLPLLRY